MKERKERGHSSRWQWSWSLCLLVLLICWQGPLESCRVFAANTITSALPVTSPVIASSSSLSPTSSPTPTPPPTSYFLKYVHHDCFYIYIANLTIEIFTDDSGYYNLTADNAAFVKSHHYNSSVVGCKGDTDSITFLQSYRFQNDSFFNLTFHLDLEPTSTDQTWYISSFYHHNSSTDRFTYTGLKDVITAPSDMSYYCSRIRFGGQTLDGIRSEVTFTGLRIQAFGLKGTSPSTTYIDCGARNKNNNTINLVVGLVVGGTLMISLVVIVVTLVVKRIRKRGYDLLDE